MLDLESYDFSAFNEDSVAIKLTRFRLRIKQEQYVLDDLSQQDFELSVDSFTEQTTDLQYQALIADFETNLNHVEHLGFIHVIGELPVFTSLTCDVELDERFIDFNIFTPEHDLSMQLVNDYVQNLVLHTQQQLEITHAALLKRVPPIQITQKLMQWQPAVIHSDLIVKVISDAPQTGEPRIAASKPTQTHSSANTSKKSFGLIAQVAAAELEDADGVDVPQQGMKDQQIDDSESESSPLFYFHDAASGLPASAMSILSFFFVAAVRDPSQRKFDQVVEDERAFKKLAFRLECAIEPYLESAEADFFEILEDFQPDNPEHVRRATTMLKMLEKPYYETYLRGDDELAKHLRKVRFELVPDGAGSKLQYQILEDFFGKCVPNSFRYKDISWKTAEGKRVYASFATIKTQDNCFVVFVDGLELKGSLMNERTASTGAIFKLLNEFRLLARKAGAIKLFVQFDEFSNERLTALLTKRYQYYGVMPMVSTGRPYNKTTERKLFFGEGYQDEAAPFTIELDLPEPTATVTPPLKTKYCAEAIEVDDDDVYVEELPATQTSVVCSSTDAIQAFNQALEQRFSLASASRNDKFDFYAISNEVDYWQVIRSLEHVRANPNHKRIKVALLFGESNFLSLLPILSELADVVIMADIETRLHQHNRFLLDTFKRSDSVQAFVENYKQRADNFDVHYVDRLIGRLSDAYSSLREYYFLYDQARYDHCRQALANVSITQIQLNLATLESCQDLARLLQSHNAEFTLCNFTNIHNYCEPKTLYATTTALLHDASSCVVMASQGIISDLSTYFSVGLRDYHTYNLHLTPEELSATCKAAAALPSLIYSPKAVQTTSTDYCYVGLSASFNDIQSIVNGLYNPNYFSHQLHACSTHEEACLFLEREAQKTSSGPINREINWVFKLRGVADKANDLLNYKGELKGDDEWVHTARYVDQHGMYFSELIVEARNIAGTNLLEKSAENPYEKRVRVLFPQVETITEPVIELSSARQRAIIERQFAFDHFKFNELSSRFKAAKDALLDRAYDEFNDVVDLFDPNNSEHVRRAKNLLGFFETPSYDTYIRGKRGDTPAIKKVHFELVVEGTGTIFKYTEVIPTSDPAAKPIVNNSPIQKIIHIKQAHAVPSWQTINTIEYEHVVHSQWRVALEIKQRPACLVVDEGWAEDVLVQTDRFRKLRTLFPTGFPAEYGELTAPQKQALYQYGGTDILFSLGEIPCIYRSMTDAVGEKLDQYFVEHKEKTEGIAASQSSSEYTKSSIMKISHQVESEDFLYQERELDAIACVKRAGMKDTLRRIVNDPEEELKFVEWIPKTINKVRAFFELVTDTFRSGDAFGPPSKTVLLVYGGAHDFKQHCEAQGILHEEIDTVDPLLVESLKAKATPVSLIQSAALPTPTKIPVLTVSHESQTGTLKPRPAPAPSRAPVATKPVGINAQATPAQPSYLLPRGPAIGSKPVEALPVQSRAAPKSGLPARINCLPAPDYKAVNYTLSELFEWQETIHAQLSEEAVILAEKLMRNEYLLESSRIKDTKRFKALLDHALFRREMPGHISPFFDKTHLGGKVWKGWEYAQIVDLPARFAPTFGEPKLNIALKRIGIGQSPFVMGLLPGLAGHAAGRVAGWVCETFGGSESHINIATIGTATVTTGLIAAAMAMDPIARTIYMATVGTAQVADVLAKYETEFLSSVSNTDLNHVRTRATTAGGQLFNGLFGLPIEVFLGACQDVGNDALFEYGDQQPTATSHTARKTVESIDRLLGASEKIFTAIGERILSADQEESALPHPVGSNSTWSLKGIGSGAKQVLTALNKLAPEAKPTEAPTPSKRNLISKEEMEQTKLVRGLTGAMNKAEEKLIAEAESFTVPKVAPQNLPESDLLYYDQVDTLLNQAEAHANDYPKVHSLMKKIGDLQAQRIITLKEEKRLNDHVLNERDIAISERRDPVTKQLNYLHEIGHVRNKVAEEKRRFVDALHTVDVKRQQPAKATPVSIPSILTQLSSTHTPIPVSQTTPTNSTAPQQTPMRPTEPNLAPQNRPEPNLAPQQPAPVVKQAPPPVRTPAPAMPRPMSQPVIPVPVVQPAPPPRPLVMSRPIPPQLANFTNHLWSQEFQRNRYQSTAPNASSTWASQLLKSSSSLNRNSNPLAPRSLYQQLHEASKPIQSLNLWSVKQHYAIHDHRMKDQARDLMWKVRREGGTFYDVYTLLCKQTNTPFDRFMFMRLLQSTGLVDSHNSMLFGSRVPRLSRLDNDIGGVATEVGIIKGLRNTIDHAFIDFPRFCMKTHDGKLPFSHDELKQIFRELAIGLYVEQEAPFFSLHFNTDGNMYPVIHPVYRDALVGYTIAKLDYDLKGFLQGSLFDEANKLIDLKKYCIEQKLGFEYLSLRERHFLMTHALGLTESDSFDNIKFQTSFRIIANQNRVTQDSETHAFIIEPDFEVQYTIDLTPEYKAEIERHRQERGEYPPYYQAIKALYANMAEDIKEQMPKIPVCRDAFYRLGVISFFSYYLNTLNENGMAPKFTPIVPVNKSVCPPFFLPIPIRYYKKEQLTIPLQAVMTALSLADKKAINTYLKSVTSTTEANESKALSFFEKAITATIDTIGTDEAKIAAKKHVASLALELLKTLVSQTQAFQNELVKQFKIKLTNTSTFADLLRELKKEAAKHRVKEVEAIVDWVDAEVALKDALTHIQSHWGSLNAPTQQHPENQRAYQAKIAEIQSDQAELMTVIAQIEPEYYQRVSALVRRYDSNKKAIAHEVNRLIDLDQWPHEAFVGIQAIKKQMDDLIVVVDVSSASFQFDVVYSTLEMPDSPTYHETAGKSFKIIGGCSVRMPNRDLEPAVLPSAWVGALKSTFKMLAPETFSIIRLPGDGGVAGGSYAAFSLAVEAKPSLSPLDRLELLQSLTRATLRSEIQQPDYLTPLFQAVIAGDSELVRTLLTQGANPNVHMPDGLFPLYVAIQNHDESMALLLIANTSTLVNKTLYFNNVSGRGENALQLAIHLKQETVANALIARGADFRLKQVADGKMALHLAVQAGLIATVTAILRQDPNLVDSALPSGETALHLAVEACKEAMVECLVNRYKAKVTGRNQVLQTPLMLAIRLAHTEIAALLAEHDKVESNTKPNYEALVLAATFHQWEIADRLFERQVTRFDPTNKSIQDYLYQLLRQGQCARFTAIAEKNPAILQLKFEGKSCLAIACEQGHLLLMHYLQVKKVALINPDKPDWTWIDYAVKANDPGMLREWLAANKANITVMQKLAYIAAEHNALACLKVLMGELTQAQLKSGYQDKSVFYAAIVSGKVAIVDAMTARYPTLVNEQMDNSFPGELPLLLAAKWGHTKIIKQLCRSGAQWYGVYSPRWEDYAEQLAILLLHQKDVEVFKLVLQFIPADKLPARLLESLLYAALHFQQGELLALMTPEIIKGLPDEAKTFALIRACSQGSLEWVKKLVEYGAKPASTCYKPSLDMVLTKKPLDAAVAHGHADIVDYLIPLVDAADHYNLHTYDSEVSIDSYHYHTSYMNKHVANIASLAVRDDIVPVLRKYQLFPDNEKALNQEKLPPFVLFKEGHLGEWNRRKEALFKTLLAGDEAAFTKAFIAFPSAEMSMGVYNDKAPFSAATQFTHDGVTQPLMHWAIHKNAFWALPIMISHGLPLDYSKDNEGKTTLHKIAKLPEAQARQWIKFLKELNWNFRFLRDKQGLHATDYALNADRLWLLKEFCSFFSDPDKLLMYGRDGQTVLHRACASGKMDFVDYILAQGVSANIETFEKITPFMIAAGQGNIALMQLLLKHGANPNLRTITHDNALHIALKGKQESAALWLVTVMAPSEMRRKDRDGLTPLMLAAARGLEVMTRHLVNPSEIERISRMGRTAMHYGAFANHPGIIRILASNGFEVDAVTQPKESTEIDSKMTPLLSAAHSKNAQSFAALLEVGADTYIENSWHHSALWFAAKNEDEELTQQLIALPESGLPEQQEKLWFAAAAGNNVTLLRQLCLLEFPIQSIDATFGQNALHKACSEDAIQVGHLLLAAGVDAELPDKNGNTPLHCAAQKGSVALVKALCERRVNVNVQNAKQQTPLHLAIEAGHEAVVLLLMKYNAKTDLQDRQGVTSTQSGLRKFVFFKEVNARGVDAVIKLQCGNTTP